MSELNLLQYCDDGKEYEVTLRDGRIKKESFKKLSAALFYPILCSNGFTYKTDGFYCMGGIYDRDIISVKPVTAEQTNKPKGTKMKKENHDLIEVKQEFTMVYAALQSGQVTKKEVLDFLKKIKEENLEVMKYVDEQIEKITAL